MNTAAHILAAVGIIAALGSIIAQLIYLRAICHGLHLTATAALGAAAILCTVSVTITICLCLP